MKKAVLCLLLTGAAFATEKKRIVSVGAIASELVCEIGACGDIVATDVTSVYPPELLKKPKVGYVTRLSAEGILALRPTHMVVIDGAGPATVLDQLKQSGVKIVKVPVGIGLGDAAKRLEILGEFAGNAPAAKKLSQKMRADVAQLSHQKKSKRPPKVLFIYARGAQTLLAMGANTTAHELIELAGAANAFDAEGAKPVNAEAIAASQADIVLIPEGSLAGLGGAEALQKIPGFAQTPAGKKRRLVTLEDSLLAGMGPRTAAAARTLRNKIAEAMQK
jgi:iron complex transport system substrate-binding protein